MPGIALTDTPLRKAVFLGYVRIFLGPPSTFGVGTPSPVRNLTTEVFPNSVGDRRRVVFAHNGRTGGQIESVITSLATPLRAAGADVRIVANDTDVARLCPSSLRGLSGCYAAVSFFGSPTEGTISRWAYRVTADFALGYQFFVDRNNNDAEIFSIPLIHAIDSAIGLQSGRTLPQSMLQFPFTSRSQEEHDDEVQINLMGSVNSWLAAASVLAICGITFHLPGFAASEREIGMSQLIDAMMSGTHQTMSQILRLLSTHLAFDLVYIPSWIVIGAVYSVLIYLRTSQALVIGCHILVGLAFSSFSTFCASFFRRSQLSGIFVLICTLVAAVVAQVAPIDASGGIIALSVLFPSAAYTYLLIELAAWERLLLPANISRPSPNSIPGVSGSIFVALLAVHMIGYALLAVVIEKWRWGSSSQGRRVQRPRGDSNAAIMITNFSKRYKTGIFRAAVKAVNELNLTVLRGETMVLLGANGSGKSTTLDTISGIISPTSGLIEVDGSGGLGLCPQKNVMWDELTVAEHIAIFTQLKAQSSAVKTETQTLLRGCDLEGKQQKKSKTLSGGQKRKLQLAMAFAGGSRVCCIDEVSSGLDPLSRRKIWDILIQERGRRTLLFTTHALDEADALADHVAIMSKGNLKVEGSVVALKSLHGGGYRVHVPAPNVPLHTPPTTATPVSTDTETIYQVGSSSAATRFVEQLEAQGIAEYSVMGPTIEDVFLKVADEGRDELSHGVAGSRVPPKGSKPPSLSSSDPEYVGGAHGVQLTMGKEISFPRQSWILLCKRFRILSRNYFPYICALLIPLVASGLVTFLLSGYQRPSCSLAIRSASARSVSVRNVAGGFRIPVGPTSRWTRSQVTPWFARYYLGRIIPFTSYRSWESFTTGGQFVLPGGAYLGSANGTTPTFAYRIDGGIYYSAFTKVIFDSYLLELDIDVSVSTFALPITRGIGNALQLVVYLGLALSAFPAFFALYPTYERLRNIRTLHYGNGVLAAPLWLAYSLFDMIFVLVISVVAVIIFVSLRNVWYGPGYLWAVFFLFGLSSTLLSYIVSLFASSQLAAFAFAAGGQAVFVLLYFVTYIALVSFGLPESLVRNMNIVQFTFCLITPSGNLIRALILALNLSQLSCRDSSYVSYPGNIEIYGGPILYLMIQVMAFYAFLVAHDNGWRPRWAILKFDRRGRRPGDRESSADISEKAIAAETLRTEKSQDALRVLHVNKSFGSEVAVDDLTFGVQHGEVFALLGPNGAGKSTTISLIRGDLRPTPARISNSQQNDILVEGLSMTSHRASARQTLGVCPQFDAIDRMTVTEHLRFYAHASGVPRASIADNVDAVIQAVGLGPFRHSMADALSGGNKRKMSLGISIMGNPSVLLLDEPSSGMDAISKRIMWKLLASVKPGRSLVLTSHSMEEVDALADRAGIMAKKMLAVGTTAYLRDAHRDGFFIQLVHKDAPHVSDEQGRSIEEWITAHIRGAAWIGLRGDTGAAGMLHGQARFHIPLRDQDAATTHSMVSIMKLLERSKEELDIGFFSISTTTLEDVFIDVVSRYSVFEHEDRR